MTGAADGWELRPLRAPADRGVVEALWLAALDGQWPLLPYAVDLVRDGFVAVAGGRPVGMVAVDLAGSVPLVLVAPGWQRRGVGTAMLRAALGRLHAAGVTGARAGSGGAQWVWPGVPLDLTAAVRLFTACGWRAWRDDTLDLTASLPGYQALAGAMRRAARAGVTITLAAADQGDVAAFEAAEFPEWARWFQAGEGVLLARDRRGTVVATLLLDGPGADFVFTPMLGPDAATIGCVGVAPRWHGRGVGTALVARASEILRDRGAGTCHISWTVRESFYTRAGYRPWRRYRMFAAPAGPA